MQGHSDIPVDDATLAELSPLSQDWQQVPCLSSPLKRCRQTAKALGLDPVDTPLLIEQHWGDWEGYTLAELRDLEGAEEFRANEDRGLDFEPMCGESPRQVQWRLEPLMQQLAGEEGPAILMTHKGVIRALLGLATSWNFMGKPPARVGHDRAQILWLHPDARLTAGPLDLRLDELPSVAEIMAQAK
ncbi:MAG: histidine phosphatase family protein [Alphaproteobacteria bacterium]